MKHLIQKFTLIFGLLGLAFPVQAKTYNDVKFLEAIEQNIEQKADGMLVEVGIYPAVQIGERLYTNPRSMAYLKTVERCLEQGVDVNQQMPNSNKETPLMRTINLMAQDGATLCANSCPIKKDGKSAGGAFIIGGLVLAGMSIERNFLWGDEGEFTRARNGLFTIAGFITVLAGLYYEGRIAINTVRNMWLLENMQARLEVIKMLLKHPSIDVTITNSQGKTVFDLMNEHLEQLKKFEKDSTYAAPYMIQYVQPYSKCLNDAHALLKAKKSENAQPTNG